MRDCAIVENLQARRATDVLLFALAYPRQEFVFQPKYAAYPNLIEPWRNVLKSVALRGRWFETWADVCRALDEATAYWNRHPHPFIWGHRRRHRPNRKLGSQPFRLSGYLLDGKSSAVFSIPPR
jgi:hypothetical protein